MAFIFTTLFEYLLEEVAEYVVVTTAVAATTYVATETVSRVAGSLGESGSSFSSSSSGFYLERKTIFDWWCHGISSTDREILFKKGYSDYGGCFSLEELDRTLDNHYFEKAPGKPTEKEGFKPEKNWDGKTLKKEPNGQRRGYPHKDGSVWVPTGKGSGDGSKGPHGGSHWDVEYPNGSHENVYPGGRRRWMRLV